jgi:hypothetical protein
VPFDQLFGEIGGDLRVERCVVRDQPVGAFEQVPGCRWIATLTGAPTRGVKVLGAAAGYCCVGVSA